MKYQVTINFKGPYTKPLVYQSPTQKKALKELNELLDHTVDKVTIYDKASNRQASYTYNPNQPLATQ